MTAITHILRDHLNNEPTSPFQTDWEELLAISKAHEVTAIVYSQCKDFIPKHILPEYERSYSSVVYYYLNRTKLLAEVDAQISDIDHFTIKGASVASYYPIPAFRTMGDTDIVVRTEDREEVHRRLLEMGFSSHSKFDDREWQYYKNSMELELHDHLVYKEAVNEEKQVHYFNSFRKYMDRNVLDWDFHFMFLIFHLRKHFMNSGVGYRQFMDIAVLTFRGPEFDWDWIRDELRKLELWTFTERVFALNEYWFDIHPPIPVEMPSQQFLDDATTLIERNGVFGFNNEDNKMNAAVNKVRGDDNTKAAMIRNAVKNLFPDEHAMSSVPHYSYVKGRPLLLPLAWIHRFLRSILNRRVRKNMKTVINTSFVDADTIQKRKDIYKQWGL